MKTRCVRRSVERRPAAASLLAALACCASALSGSGALAEELLRRGETPRAALELLTVTPSGEDVQPGRQIVFQFDRPVVPIGRMARSAAEVPIEIRPDPGCSWRWLDTAALACQLGEENPLAPATRYHIRVGGGLVAADGAELAAVEEHAFVTRRPRVRYRRFETWTSPVHPKIRLTFDQAVSEESVERHVFFSADAGAERMAVALERDAERRHTWIVVPVRPLPAGAAVELRVEPGLRSRVGPEPGVEDRPIASFSTFGAPRFLGVACLDLTGDAVRLDAPAAADPRELRCDPLAPVELRFSAPVLANALAGHLQVEPRLPGERDDAELWAGAYSYSHLSRAPPEDAEYTVRLPSPLRARTTYTLRAPASDVLDEFGRALETDVDFSFGTDHRRPRLDLGNASSVLERDVDSHLPVIVTNLERVLLRYQRQIGDRVDRQQRVVEVDTPRDEAHRWPLRVRDWLEGASGAVLGTMSSSPVTARKPRWFFSQVTPFQVHAKLGHYNGLVWVTDLATGEPVAGATVEVFAHDFESLPREPEILASGRTNREGLVALPGTAQLDPKLARLRRWWPKRSEDRFFVRVRGAGDAQALLPLSADFALRPRGPGRTWVSSRLQPPSGHMRAWGFSAQGVYRAGDTAQLKLYLRREGNETLEPTPGEGLVLEVVDPTDTVVHTIAPLVLDAYGAWAGELALPETASYGRYRVRLTGEALAQGLEAFTFLVTDFTPAPFRVTTDLHAELFGPGDEVEVTTRAALHAGGPYAAAASRVTARIRPTAFEPSAPAAKGFEFSTGERTGTETPHRSEAVLDGQGERVTRFALPESKVTWGTLEVESAVRDDRGKYVAGRTTALFAGRDRYVGIRQPDWILKAGEAAEVMALVASPNGELSEGDAIEVRVEKRVTKAGRVKGAGNAYVTHFTHSWEELERCSLVSTSGPVACAFTPDAAGAYRLSAKVSDALGRTTESVLHRYAAGPGVVLWEESPGYHLEIAPERDDLRVGDTARYLVRNPFPGAKALVTVERNGVQKSWVETFDESTEVLELDVEPDFLPGFYLSVVVTSPRVEAPPGDGVVDLGKPAFRMGYAVSVVRDPYKELAVEVVPAAPSYRPRETARVALRVLTRQGDPTPAQLAIAVLDEAVLDLLPGGTSGYDPYAGLYELGALDLRNFNLLKQLVGLQSFERKGATQGGGGGGGRALRSLFEFVSYWNPALEVDADGRAQIEFPLPDNLTGWRVLAVAVSPSDRMGLGHAHFAVDQPTEIRPALPNQITAGDSFEARFTVVNRTDAVRTLEVAAEATGPVRGAPAVRVELEAEPYRRVSVGLPVDSVDAGGSRPGRIELRVEAGDARDRDGLAVSVPVRARAPLEVAASYGSTTGAKVEESVRLPEDLTGDAGRLSVEASASVVGGLEGAFRYMVDYPYTCWEQRMSKGVMAAHYQALRSLLSPELDWEESAELPAQVLAKASDFQAPGGAMTWYVPRDENASPYLSAYTALAFGWLRDLGHDVPEEVEGRLHAYLDELLRKDVLPTFYSKGMASTVRAVALAALARSGGLTLDDVERYRRHVPEMSLFGKAHYLEALRNVAGADELSAEVEASILAHGSFSAGKAALDEELDDGFARILDTPLRASCAVLAALVTSEGGASPQVRELAPRLVRQISQARGQRDHWENTQENAFCTHAIVAYSRAFESESPDFEVDVAVDDETLGTLRFGDRRDPARSLGRAIARAEAGRDLSVRIDKRGAGRLYYATRLAYDAASARAEAANAGIDVRRELSLERGGRWELVGSPTRLETGDVVRVDLYVSLPSARHFVVVDDPVPGGLEPVDRSLATASTVDADAAVSEYPPDAHWFEYDDWRSFAVTRWSFSHRELRHDAARFYSEYLPAGRYHLSYVAQAIAPGRFVQLPVRAEEMYDPDVFGRGVSGVVEIEASP